MNYRDFIKPGIAATLGKLKLDKSFFKADSNYLYYLDDQQKERKVLDFVGGYGSLAIGHNHPELVDYAKELFDKKTPIHSQLSNKFYCGELGKKISDEIEKHTNEKYVVTLTNSGAESVEAAFKHARFKKKNEIESLIKKINNKLNYIDNQALKGNVKGFRFNDIESVQDLKNYIINHNNQIVSTFHPVILASEKSYHGKTMEALKATFNDKYKNPFLFESEKNGTLFFNWELENFIKLVSQNKNVLLFPELSSVDGYVEIKSLEFNSCIAAIIEPILGEGGIINIPVEFLEKIREITAGNNIPLIFDEIQTGIYRTGTFLYSQKIKVYADYYLIGKSLGGGIGKIGALVIKNKQYESDFGILHTSTFAEDEFTSAIALKTLEILEKASSEVNSLSKYLFEKLEILQQKSGFVIESVSGEGLMIGVKFKNYNESLSYPLQFISRSGYFNYFIASFMLNNHDIRIAPTLSDSFTIRLQPSLFIAQNEIDSLIKSLEEVTAILKNEDFYYLIKHLLPAAFRDLRSMHQFNNGTIEIAKQQSDYRVGFLVHYIDIDGVMSSDASIQMLPSDIIEDFLYDFVELNSTIILGTKIIKNKNSEEVEVVFCGLPFTSNMVKTALENNNIAIFRNICHTAIDNLKEEFDIKIIGLGQFTSILTKNGTTIPRNDIGITTGNSFTVYIGVQSVLDKMQKLYGTKKFNVDIAIIGAAGNICSVYSKCFTKYASTIYLKGSDSPVGYKRVVEAARDLLQYVIQNLLYTEDNELSNLENSIKGTELYRSIKNSKISITDQGLYKYLLEELGENCPIKVIQDIESLQECKLIVIATNNTSSVFTAADFSENTLVYDISVPQNVFDDPLMAKKNIEILTGGVVKLPKDEVLPLLGFPLEGGNAFACISETLLLGFEKFEGNFSFGSITPEMVEQIGEIGIKHGFRFYKNKSSIIF